MKKVSLPIFIALIAVGVACTQTAEKTNEPDSVVATEEVVEAEEPTINVEEEVVAVNKLRGEIEEKVANIEPLEMSTQDMRAQVAQKWNMLHVYAVDGEVIRIKTYPHDAVSKRTEEFYLDNGELRLAVIEDNGTGDRGKKEADINKMYYFLDGKVIKEINNSDEGETAIRNSDGERLIQECNEYLAAYQNL